MWGLFSTTSVRSTAVSLPLVTAIGWAGICCAGIGMAVPVPAQPGVTVSVQPGETTTGRVYVRPVSPPSAEPPPPASDFGRVRYRPAPRYAAPVDPSELHLPTQQRAVAPILPPTDSIRIGEFVSPAPTFIPDEVVHQINSAAADVEARMSTFSRSIGIAPHRSDLIAAAAVGGAVTGAVGAGLAAALVTGGVGAVLGGVVGGGIGAVAALAPAGLGTPMLGPAIGVGALIGAGLGGAALASFVVVPAAIAGGVAGGIMGTCVGSATL